MMRIPKSLNRLLSKEVHMTSEDRKNNTNECMDPKWYEVTDYITDQQWYKVNDYHDGLMTRCSHADKLGVILF